MNRLLFHKPTVSTSDSSDTTAADRIATLITQQDPRCQQLAALEAEIGRAVIGYDFVHYALGDKSYEPNLSHAYMLLCMEKANLIAQWRKLHAEGAEAEAATERQEGER